MLETDYYIRMKEEHKDELGIFGRVEMPKYIEGELNEEDVK